VRSVLGRLWPVEHELGGVRWMGGTSERRKMSGGRETKRLKSTETCGQANRQKAKTKGQWT
jgi:hypothetical protein